MDHLIRKSNLSKLILFTGIILFSILGVQFTLNAETTTDKSGADAISSNGVACIGGINISLGADGKRALTPDLFLMGSGYEYDDFIVVPLHPAVTSDTVYCAHVGLVFFVEVIDLVNNNRCTSEVTVCDDLVPWINCEDVELECYESTDIDFGAFPEIYLAGAGDNCTDSADLDIRFDVMFRGPLNCSDPNYSYRVIGKWTVTDESGNSSFCIQTFNYKRLSVDDVDFPADITIQCGVDEPDTSITGVPTYKGHRLTGVCCIMPIMEDYVMPLMCGDQKRIERTWTLYETCPPYTSVQHTQIIWVKDTTPPTLSCPTDFTLSTDPGKCSTDFTIVIPEAEEDCVDPADLEYSVYVDGIKVTADVVNLSEGEHEITVHVKNPCNWKVSSCTYLVTVVDNEPPTLVCRQGVGISLGADGTLEIPVSTISNTYNDNCGIAEVKARRLTEGCGFDGTEDPSDILTFCCDDVGKVIQVEFFAWDFNGNVNSCIGTIEIEDNVDPVVDFCPEDRTITCDDIADLSIYGEASFSDNCGVVSVDYEEELELDNCSVGTITRTWTAYDAQGNSAVCTQVLQVEYGEGFDESDIDFPEDITLEICNVDLDDLDITGQVIVNYNGCNLYEVDYNDTELSMAACIEIIREFIVTDICTSVEYRHEQSILVLNYDSPDLAVPADETVYTSADECEVYLELTPAQVSDCSPGAIIENDLTSGGAEVNYSFPIGETIITFTATDACGHVSQGTTSIVVIDTFPPVIDCPDDFTVDNDPGECGANVIVPLPEIDNICGTDSIYNNRTGAGAASDYYEIGEWVITYYAVDLSGNVDSCTVTITVEDTEAPVISCPDSEMDIYVDEYCNYVIPDFLGNLNPSDNCTPSDEIQLSQIPEAGASVSGDTIVIITAVDGAGNTTTCEVAITAIDTIAPVITGPDTVYVHLDSDCAYLVPDVITGRFVDENCALESVVQTPVAGDEREYDADEEVIITIVATDVSGNTDEKDITVIFTYSGPITIECPGNITVENDPGECRALVNVGDPVLGGICGNYTISNDYNNETNASGYYNVGTTIVTYTVVDDFGNEAECSFMVTVIDSEKPTVTCPDSEMDIYVNEDCEYEVPDFLGNLNPQDNCTPSGEIHLSQTPEAGDWISGDVIVVITAVDSSGNTTTCEVAITAIDTIAPVITGPDTVYVALDSDCGYFIPDVITGRFIEENCALESVVQTPAAGDEREYDVDEEVIITIVATDVSGNTDEKDITVIFTYSGPITIDCPANITVENDPGECGAEVMIGEPIVGGVCGNYTISNSYNSTTNASDYYEVGTTTVTFTVVDDFGNEAECSFTVTVIDSEKPTVTCPDAEIDVYVNEDCEYEVPDFLGNLNPQDNCTPSDEIQLSQTPEAGDWISGDVIVVITAVDSSGNATTCEVAITAIDTIAPVIAGPDTIYVALYSDCAYLVPDVITGRFIEENCALESVVQTPAAGDEREYDVDEEVIITIVATDVSGNTDEKDITVIFTYSGPITIDCPGDITVENDPGECGAEVTIGEPVVGGICGNYTISNSYNSTTNASDYYEVGTRTVTFTVVDDFGNEAECSFTVTVVDAEAPELSGPAEITVELNENCEYEVPNVIGLVSADDNCAIDTIIQTPEAGGIIPSTGGPQSITVTATDIYGNSTTIEINLDFEELVPPVIVCPEDITVEIEGENVCEGFVEVPLPAIIESCSDVTITNDYTSGESATGYYEIGETTVTYYVENASGLVAECTVKITVVKTDPLIIVCPADQVLYVNENCVATVPDYTGLADIVSCEGYTDVTISQTPAPGTVINNDVSVQLTASRPGMTASCEFWITLVDTIPPVVTGPDTITVQLDEDCTFRVPSVIDYLTSWDNCGAVNIVQSPDVGDLLSYPADQDLNIHIVITDGSGNTNDFTMVLHAIDTIAPVIVCPADITVNNDAGECGAYVEVDLPETDNICGDDIISNSFTSTESASGIYPVGVTEVTYYVEDAFGNVSTCTVTVTVLDTEAPVVVCPDTAMDIYVDANCVYEIPDFLTDLEVSDNCGTGMLEITQVPTAGSTASGNTTVVITVTDASGNTTSCEVDITAIDTIAPIVDAPFSLDVILNEDCEYVVPNAEDYLIYSDNCDDPVVSQTPAAGELITHTALPHKIYVTVTDESGNATNVEIDLNLIDTIAPVIICPEDITITLSGSECEADVSIPLPEVGDACGIQTFYNDYTGGENASGIYPIGVTEVKYYAINSYGLMDSCEFTVTVIKENPLVVECPVDQVLYVNENCVATVPDYTGLADIVSCEGYTDVTISQTPVPGTVINNDVSVQLTASRPGMTASCEFLITLVDTIPPVVTGPDTITVQLDEDCTFRVPSVYDYLTSWDNCGTVLLDQSPDVGDLLSYPGNQDLNIHVVITDGSGNTSDFTMVLHAIDTIAPVIVCPADITVNNDAGECGAYVEVDLPETDNICGDDIISNSFTSTESASGIYPVGVTEVTYYVEDAFGNVSTCTVTVTVLDTEAPVVTCPATEMDIHVNENCEYEIPDFLGLLNPQDNCTSSGEITLSQVPAAGTMAIDNIVVVITAIDSAGNVTTCEVAITGVDTIAPVITGPGTLVVELDADCNYIIPDVESIISINENCQIESVVQTPLAGTEYSYPDDAVITIVVTDASGNFAIKEIELLFEHAGPIYIECPADITIANNSGECGADVTVPLPVINGVCGNYTITNSRNSGSSASDYYSVGTETVTYTVEDEFGNEAECTFTVTVIDTEAPVVTCPGAEMEIYVDENCEYEIPDFLGLLNPQDNCTSSGEIVLNQVPAAGTMAIDNIVVVITATDNAGNVTTCEVAITGVDTIPPFVDAPASIDVELNEDCEYVVPDAESLLYSYSDNCGIVTVEQTPEAGDLIFHESEPHKINVVVRDAAGNETSVEIDLNLINNNKPQIICPEDFTFSLSGAECEAELTIPLPEVIDACGIQSYYNSYTGTEDASGIYPVGETEVTYYVENSYGLIDSCTFTVTVFKTEFISLICPAVDTLYADENCQAVLPDYSQLVETFSCAYYGPVTYTQNPKPGRLVNDDLIVEITATNDYGSFTCEIAVTFTDTIPPIMEGPESVVTYLNEECEYSVPSVFNTLTLFENCTQLTVTQSPKHGTIKDYTGVNDVITVIGVDGYGNTTTITIDLIIVDSSAVTITDPAGVIEIQSNREASVDANDYVSFNSPCGNGIVKSSWSEDDMDNSILTIACDDMTSFPMVIDTFISVFQNGGLVGSYPISLTIDDPNNYCVEPLIGAIYGVITDWEGKPVRDVEIQLHGGAEVVELITDHLGRYRFEGVELYKSYKLTVDKKDNPLNGVTTFDVLMMSKEILGEEVFTSPYQHLAADVNKSTHLSLLDVMELRQIILGYKDDFSDGRSWYINSEFFDIEGYINSFNPDKYDYSYHIETLYEEETEVNFIATKKGDVNGSYTERFNPSVDHRSSTSLLWSLEESKNGYTLVLRADRDMNIEGMQFALSIENAQVENVSSVLDNFGVKDYRYIDGELFIAYANAGATALKAGDILYEIDLSNYVRPELIRVYNHLQPEIYLEGMEQLSFILEETKVRVDDSYFALYEAEPNPMHDYTRIGFDLPSAKEVNFRLFDQNGSLVLSRKISGQEGYNSIDIMSQDLPMVGMYYYSIETDEFIATKRFIKL